MVSQALTIFSKLSGKRGDPGPPITARQEPESLDDIL